MKASVVIAAGGILLLGQLSAARSAPPDEVTAVPGMLPGIHLVTPLPKGSWPLQTGDYANTRFSPLKQINSSNVGGLHMVWTNSAFGIPHGYEGGPLVVNDSFYVMTPFPDHMLSFDLRKPGWPMNWTYNPDPSSVAVGRACCDVVNRGGSYAEGKIFYTTLDDYAIAVNAVTGRRVWRTKVGDVKLGETETMAPLVIPQKNIVIVGISGGELGVRGRVAGLDLDTGRIRWVAYSTGSDKDVRLGPGFKPFYKKDQGHNLGLSTWPKDGWKHGGGTVWGYMSYDPKLNLFYYGTGNAAPWDPDQHPGLNYWTATIFARDPSTGYAKWAWKVVPHPTEDYDEIGPNVLVDMEWHGRMRKLLIHTGKTGFVFVLDRQTGQLLSAEPFQPVNWASGFDLATGVPAVNHSKEAHLGVTIDNICPSNMGADNWEPTAFSPQTGLLYIPARNICMNFEGTHASYIAGTPYIGANVLNINGPGGTQGELVAWDVAHAKQAWAIKERFALSGGALATAGNLVFYGTLDGWFKAVDARDGKVLWKMKLGSGIVSDPMTFVGPDGKQYIALYSGIGGALGVADFPTISTDDPGAALGAADAMSDLKKVISPGGSVYVFGL